jgi:hypothetical protein
VTRSMVRDDQDQFRVVVRYRKKEINPDFEYGNGQRYYVLTDEEYTTSFGPYPRIGTARGVESKEAFEPGWLNEGDPRAKRKWDVVDSWVEKALPIKWERV